MQNRQTQHHRLQCLVFGFVREHSTTSLPELTQIIHEYTPIHKPHNLILFNTSNLHTLFISPTELLTSANITNPIPLTGKVIQGFYVGTPIGTFPFLRGSGHFQLTTGSERWNNIARKLGFPSRPKTRPIWGISFPEINQNVLDIIWEEFTNISFRYHFVPLRDHEIQFENMIENISEFSHLVENNMNKDVNVYYKENVLCSIVCEFTFVMDLVNTQNLSLPIRVEFGKHVSLKCQIENDSNLVWVRKLLCLFDGDVSQMLENWGKFKKSGFQVSTQNGYLLKHGIICEWFEILEDMKKSGFNVLVHFSVLSRVVME